MRALAFVVAVSCALPCAAQDTAALFDRLTSKDEAEADAAHAELVKLGEPVIEELERRLAKKPAERVAVRLRAVLSAIQLADLDALLTPRLELPDAAQAPAVISPDGKHVAYAAQVADRSFEYRVATLTDDGKLKLKTVLACGERMRGHFFASALQPGCWSPDSRYLGYIDFSAEDRKRTVCGYVEVATGKLTQLAGAEGSEINMSVRFAPQTGRVAWIELSKRDGQLAGSVKTRELKSGETKDLPFPAEFAPVDLRYQSDGRAVALGAQGVGEAGRPQGALYVLSANRTSLKKIEADFDPDDFFWSGPAAMCQRPDVPRVFVESRGVERKRPSRIFGFALEASEGKLIVPESTYSLASLIDAKRAMVWAQDRSGAGVLDLSTGEVTPLGHKRILLHRVGERAVFVDGDAQKSYVN